MASRIQGITVEIGGDTTKLSKALESVNKSIKGTQSGLKDVNKLLKLDPSNTELVVQKQKMLKDAIEATKEKLEDVVYVHVMFNSDLKRIVVRGCDENDKDALRWCIAKPDKRKSRKMTCKPFSELVYKEMGWDTECRYKMHGYRISFEGEHIMD